MRFFISDLGITSIPLFCIRARYPSNWPDLLELVQSWWFGDTPLGAVLLSVVKGGGLVNTGSYFSAIDASNVWSINY
ncbi:hypothetical protein DTA24_18040 [Klebsiella sp. P1CD1]|nr:hypothetical protein DTA24_18040 [Klebsiella sp. P1CD1]